MLRHLRMTEIANEVKLKLFYFADWMMPCSGSAAARVSYNRSNTNLFISGWDPEGEFCRRVAGIGRASNLDLSIVRSDLVRTNQRHLCRGNWKIKAELFFVCCKNAKTVFIHTKKSAKEKMCSMCCECELFCQSWNFLFLHFSSKSTK